VVVIAGIVALAVTSFAIEAAADPLLMKLFPHGGIDRLQQVLDAGGTFRGKRENNLGRAEEKCERKNAGDLREARAAGGPHVRSQRSGHENHREVH